MRGSYWHRYIKPTHRPLYKLSKSVFSKRLEAIPHRVSSTSPELGAIRTGRDLVRNWFGNGSELVRAWIGTGSDLDPVPDCTLEEDALL